MVIVLKKKLQKNKIFSFFHQNQHRFKKLFRIQNVFIFAFMDFSKFVENYTRPYYGHNMKKKSNYKQKKI